MRSLYQQTGLQDDLASVMRGRKEGVPNLEQQEETYLRQVTEGVYQSLQAALYGVESHPIPKLKLYPTDHPEEANTIPSVDQQGLHVGLGFLQYLNSVVCIYTTFLLQNYLWQISPLMGDVPPLSKIVSPEAFSKEALTMHAASLIPHAVARDGYVRRPFQAIMEFIQTASFSSGSSEESSTSLSRWLDKPPLDLRIYLRDLDFNALANLYIDERGPYCVNLHCQMLLDAVYFLLAHEVAHYLLDHHTYIPEARQSRDEEAHADLKALKILDTIPDFKVRSLLTLFSFCHLNEPEISPDQTDHPFSRNRILILADTILKNRYDEELRADINAGMTLMTIPLDPIEVNFNWDNDYQENFVILPYFYSDSDYCAHLLLYLERPPYKVEFHDGGRENASLLLCLTLEMGITLRNRIHPDQVFYQGRVSIRPGITKSNLLMVYGEEAVLTRMHLRIACLPEWWLNHPESEVTITALAVKFEPDTDPSEDIRPQIKFFLDPVDLNYDAYLKTLPSSREDPFAWANVRLAARRFHEWSQAERAICFYNWIYSHELELLKYPDLIDLAHDLILQNKLSNAANIARNALAGITPMRPGFNLIVAQDLLEKGQIHQAYDHAFLEMLGIGKFGEYFQQAQQLFIELFNHPEDTVMERFRDFHTHYDSGQKKESHKEVGLAIEEYRLALLALDQARQLVQGDFVSLQEFTAETMLEICALEGRGQQAVRQAFEQVLEIEPNFAPAYVQLARLALLEGNEPRAHEIWEQANALMPFNHFVFEFRDVVEQPNPDFSIQSHTIEEAFARPVSDNKNKE